MGPKKKVFGVSFQKHATEADQSCCQRSTLIVCDDIAEAATWARDNCPEGWTSAVNEVTQPVVVL